MTLLRPIVEADYTAVGEVHVRSWQVGYAGIVPADHLAALDPAVAAERRRTEPRPDGAQTLVAEEEDGRIVGFASFGPYRQDGVIDRNAGELYAIYVTPEQWGRGVGRQLLTAARNSLKASGYPEMRLWVLVENVRGRQFYERMDLAPDGAVQTYTPRGSTAELPELRYATPL
ncbi:GNAT family N-acetyltransferase [Paractinoplanes durhamensis]|uniref:N-acetyltransferase n=1 Tax=Paractinoplanes durhamensis TaxID=113563 RepID=A0ABQ3YML8_9ACTN|nr:GNAT family N-acetyltransferase [Actinoplanes durhamensis]GID98829.1 N-acetyltransferase [Actinoplanes durhamensis]